MTTVPVPNRLAVPLTLAGQQAGARVATLEQLRERLESGEPPEKRVSRLSEEEQRLVQQAFQRSFLSSARQLPVKIRVNGRGERSGAPSHPPRLGGGSSSFCPAGPQKGPEARKSHGASVAAELSSAAEVIFLGTRHCFGQGLALANRKQQCSRRSQRPAGQQLCPRPSSLRSV